MATPDTVARWNTVLDAHEASGLSLRSFAVSRGVKPSTLSWWRWELSRTGQRRRGQRLFLELLVDAPSEAAEVVLELPTLGAHVRVTGDTDLALLRDVLEALC